MPIQVPRAGAFNMFYESISHQILPVADATEAANKIKEGTVLSFQALYWENSHGKFYAVSDSHIDDSSFAETAFLKEINSEFFQIDSITAAWVKSTEKLAQLFIDGETEPPINSKTHLIVGKPTNQKAFFTCGCCGNRFHGVVAEQLEFGQDNGYGICTDCEQYYK
jgi:hypothetical protein